MGNGLKATAVRDIERVRELIRDFQGKTVALSRTDADYFMKLLRLQAWFSPSGLLFGEIPKNRCGFF